MSVNTVTLVPALPARKPVVPAHTPSSNAKGVAPDTVLRSIFGPRRAEQLMAGDLLLDARGQIVEVRAVRRHRAQASALVRIAPSALGLGLRPGNLDKDVILGGDQVVALRDWRTELLFGAGALVTAGRLLDGVNATPVSGRSKDLIELVFDQPTLLQIGALTIRAGCL